MKVLVRESFEVGGFCTWASLAVHHGIARWLGGEFCKKLKFVIFEMWGLERPKNVSKWIPWKSWCTKVLSSVSFAHGQGWLCTRAKLDGLVGSFVKNWNSLFLRCEGWKGLQMSPNEYDESLGAWKFWVRWVLHMAKVGGAPRHSKMARWGNLWKNEIRDFWDVRVGKAYKCLQMNTMNVLMHESFEFGGFYTWPSLAVHHDVTRWLGAEFCEKWNSWFLRCEGWKGLQMFPNEYHESLGARKFWFLWVLHTAKVGGAPRHS